MILVITRRSEVRSTVLLEAVESGEQPRSTIKGRGAGHAAVLVDRDELQPTLLSPSQQRRSLCFRAQHLLLRRDADVADRARTRTRSLALSSTHPPPTQPPRCGIVLRLALESARPNQVRAAAQHVLKTRVKRFS